MHFPADRDLNYYAQLTSERIVVKEASGHKYRVWELPSGRANEALDCRVYAYAALCALIHFGLKLNRSVEDLAEFLHGAPPLPDGEVSVAPTPATGSGHSGPTVRVKSAGSGRSRVSKLA